MVGQLKEARVPADFVELLCASSITYATGGHERVQNENCWCASTTFQRKKIRVRDIVRRELTLQWTAPRNSLMTVLQSFSKIVITWRGIVLIGCESLAFLHVALHG